MTNHIPNDRLLRRLPVPSDLPPDWIIEDLRRREEEARRRDERPALELPLVSDRGPPPPPAQKPQGGTVLIIDI